MSKSSHLEATSDIDPLVSDLFLIDGRTAEVQLYPSCLRINRKNSTQIIPINFHLSYSIISLEGKKVGIQFKTASSRIICLKEFKFQQKKWDEALRPLATCNQFHSLFKPRGKLGKGSFATVYLAQEIQGNKQLAIKAFPKESAYQDDGKVAIQNEITLLRKLKSNYIVRLQGVFQTERSLYLAMEYVKGTTLQVYLKKNNSLPIESRKKILKALLNAVSFLQKNKVVHRDLKPENIIVSQDLEQIKIIDLGLATRIDEKKYLFLRCGTPGFIAPQILKLKNSNSVRLGINSDMFSIGAIYYQILYGQPLFSGKDNQQVLKKNRDFRLPQWLQSRASEIELLNRMLQVNPNKRITPKEALRSNFLRTIILNNCRKPLKSMKIVQIQIQQMITS